MIFKLMPTARVAWRDVWVGAAVTAFLFELGKALIGLYIGRSGITESQDTAKADTRQEANATAPRARTAPPVVARTMDLRLGNALVRIAVEIEAIAVLRVSAHALQRHRKAVLDTVRGIRRR